MYDFKTFQEVITYIDQNINNQNYLSYCEDEKWKTFSSLEFTSNVKKLSRALSDAGVKKDDTFAIVSDSSPMWLMLDYALQLLGAISVPIFANISSKNLTFEIEDANISYIYIASQEKYEQLDSYLSKMKLVLTHNVIRKSQRCKEFFPFFEYAPELEEYEEINEDDIATIIYTSGSTGIPKGVELTHKNIISQIYDTAEVYDVNSNDVALSFLPLAHIFERMVMSYYLVQGVSIYFAYDVKKVPNLLKEINPSLMSVVPRLLEKIDIAMHQKAMENSFHKKLIAIAAFKYLKIGVNKNSYLYKFFDKLVFSKLRLAFGKNMRMLICGGAPLALNTEMFFKNIGMCIYQGYGLTETSPVIAANSMQFNKIGTVGLPFKSVSVKVANNSELLVKGVNVFKKYHNLDLDVFDEDGWFHTGDLASIDNDGFISIEGRLKDIFKTSNAKFVSAIHIEQLLTQNRWIDYSVIVADNKKYVSALIFLDPIFLQNYAQKHGLGDKSFEELVELKRVKKHIDEIIERINAQTNHWEAIIKYKLVVDIPTIESGILTPSMKVSRKRVYKIYENDIEKLYIGGES